mmetsp:Transcript_179/g.621  ORF Transcript_179/g.621 Transcript_179/m.621 type:complete len:105 (+) Transcript_179:795-1109(+)
MSCHMTCPKSMPSTVEELKATAEHMACHAECGKGERCHKSCPLSRQWTERKARCAEFERAACHKGCRGQGHECHAQCPTVSFSDAPPAASSPGSVVKKVLSSLI